MKKLLLSIVSLLSVNIVYSQFWATQNTAFATATRGISGLEVYDANTVWAFAYDGSGAGANVQEFTKTSNGGSTWTSGTINVGDPALKITNVSGVSATTAWAGAFDETNGLGGIWKTTDGGTTWNSQLQLTTTGESWTNFVHFFDANNGIIGGDPENGEFEVYTTTNGGTTWTRVPAASIPNPLSAEYGYNGGYSAVGDNIFFTTGKGRIFKSTDKGLTWSVLATSSIISDFGGATTNGDITWSDASKGMIMKKTYSGTDLTAMAIYITLDGGATWSNISYTGITITDAVNDISYVPGTTILVATSSSGGSWKSVDNGTTWTALDSGVQHLNVRCSDANTCYSGNFNTSSTVGGMFKSTVSLGTRENSLEVNSITIYPNPVVDYVTIKSKDKVLSVSVYDISGRLMNVKNENNLLNVKNIEAGNYVINIVTSNGSVSQKFIKK